MAYSGATIEDQAVKDFMNLKFGKDSDFMLLGMSSDFATIQTKHIEPRDENASNAEKWEKLRAMMPQDEALFAVFPFSYQVKEGGQRGKLMMISWVPNGCKLKQKMVLASSKVYLKRKLEGVAEESVQASDMGDLDYKDILKDISRGQAVGV